MSSADQAIAIDYYNFFQGWIHSGPLEADLKIVISYGSDLSFFNPMTRDESS
jgi:hypothetical protein